MSEDESAQQDAHTQQEASRAREERARLARVFGDVLPEATSDDLADGGSERATDWFERERPPHHF